ncbi:MAG: 50S ribosomal protein L18 [Candidatus Sumerlaeota bacterium]|nr:50S ribosomal protein L18 [Candidatus Sumerlaeota bacterium]
MIRTRVESIERRHRRVRGKVSGTPERPRLCVHKSLKHIYVQIIDDTSGKTLCAATSNTKERKTDGRKSFRNKAAAKSLGESLGKAALERGIKQVVLDRGGCQYHGCVRELADAVRAAGVKL